MVTGSSLDWTAMVRDLLNSSSSLDDGLSRAGCVGQHDEGRGLSLGVAGD